MAEAPSATLRYQVIDIAQGLWVIQSYVYQYHPHKAPRHGQSTPIGVRPALAAQVAQATPRGGAIPHFGLGWAGSARLRTI